MPTNLQEVFFFWTYCCGLKQHGEPLLFNMQHKSRAVSLPTSWAEGGRRAAKTREPVRRAGWKLSYNPGRRTDGWRERKTGAQTKQPAKEIKQAPDPGYFTQIKFILRKRFWTTVRMPVPLAQDLFARLWVSLSSPVAVTTDFLSFLWVATQELKGIQR